MRFLSLLLPGSLAAQNGISLNTDSVAASFYGMTEDIYIDEHLLENDDDNSQAISILNGAANNVYYNTASYNFGPMHFKYRGYSSPYTAVYVNGIEMNDLITGSFDYTSLGGMTSRAFRNKTTVVGMDAATYGFGAIGGATNYNTSAMGYAPGFAGSLAFTNSSYMLRAMATYSTGISKDGWGITVSGIGRWSDEGVVPGTFYKQGGLFVSVGKIFNARSSLTFTAYGAPLQRATSSPTYAEIFELTGDNLYNPNWGWQDGKKRSARIRQQFDPTFMANWLFQPTNATTINAGAMFRVVNYSQSRIERYKAPDPMPDYYKKLPSYYSDSPATEEFYDHLWHTDDSFRQIDWASLYQANYLNRLENLEPENADNQKGSSYIL
ncbi:MAG: TonB-dependent receptor plug domain-containing protein, partial [Bacteroidales bacterium]|nr:TonB-dependent receptor plug domain-containing protein [Bacteroidales bacterium]